MYSNTREKLGAVPGIVLVSSKGRAGKLINSNITQRWEAAGTKSRNSPKWICPLFPWAPRRAPAFEIVIFTELRLSKAGRWCVFHVFPSLCTTIHCFRASRHAKLTSWFIIYCCLSTDSRISDNSGSTAPDAMQTPASNLEGSLEQSKFDLKLIAPSLRFTLACLSFHGKLDC